MKRKIIVITIIVVIIILIGLGLNKASRKQPIAFQGQVEAREVDIAAKVPGRVMSISVREGDTVAVGDLLFELESPELTAKLAQAKAGRQAAVAMRDKSATGARDEEISIAQFSYERAQSVAELAESTYLRLNTLYDEGLIPQQKRDEAQTNAQSARGAAKAAKAQYELTLSGARSEDKAAASAAVDQADGVVAEVNAFRSETQLRSPIAAEVSSILVSRGELAPVGFPVVTLVDLSDSWVVLNVREDHLFKFKMKSVVQGKVPALDNQFVALEVFYIAALADFATWHATRYSTGYDIKTFEVRLRPLKTVDGLRPGMSVLLDQVYVQ